MFGETLAPRDLLCRILLIAGYLLHQIAGYLALSSGKTFYWSCVPIAMIRYNFCPAASGESTALLQCFKSRSPIKESRCLTFSDKHYSDVQSESYVVCDNSMRFGSCTFVLVLCIFDKQREVTLKYA